MTPTETDALRDQASTAHRAGKTAKARALYMRYLALCPNDGSIWSNVGALLRTEKQYALALHAHERAYSLSPDAMGICNNFANILSDLGHYERSISLREEILQRAPTNKSQRSLIGRCLRGLGQYRDAIDYLKAAELDHPDDAEIRLQRAFSEPGDKRYAEAFHTYEARWQTAAKKPRRMDIPQWKGEDLTDKTVLVPTAPRELIDKLTILRLKFEKVTEPSKLANVCHENGVLQAIAEKHLPKSDALAQLREELYRINGALWVIEDDIRACEAKKSFSEEFMRLARAVYVTNDKRADVKKRINLLLGSHLVEEKSYVDHESVGQI